MEYYNSGTKLPYDLSKDENLKHTVYTVTGAALGGILGFVLGTCMFAFDHRNEFAFSAASYIAFDSAIVGAQILPCVSRDIDCAGWPFSITAYIAYNSAKLTYTTAKDIINDFIPHNEIIGQHPDGEL